MYAQIVQLTVYQKGEDERIFLQKKDGVSLRYRIFWLSCCTNADACAGPSNWGPRQNMNVQRSAVGCAASNGHAATAGLGRTCIASVFVVKAFASGNGLFFTNQHTFLSAPLASLAVALK